MTSNDKTVNRHATDGDMAPSEHALRSGKSPPSASGAVEVTGSISSGTTDRDTAPSEHALRSEKSPPSASGAVEVTGSIFSGTTDSAEGSNTLTVDGFRTRGRPHSAKGTNTTALADALCTVTLDQVTTAFSSPPRDSLLGKRHQTERGEPTSAVLHDVDIENEDTTEDERTKKKDDLKDTPELTKEAKEGKEEVHDAPMMIAENCHSAEGDGARRGQGGGRAFPGGPVPVPTTPPPGPLPHPPTRLPLGRSLTPLTPATHRSSMH